MSNLNISKYCHNNHFCRTNHIRWSACFICKYVQCTNFWYVCELHNQHFASTKRCYMNKHFNKYHKVNHYFQQKQNAHLEATYSSNTEQSEINDQLNIDNDCSECTDELISYTSSKELSFVPASNNTISDHKAHDDTTNICNIVSSAFSRDNKSESNLSQTEALLQIEICDFMLKLFSTQQWQLLRILNTTKMTELQNTRVPRS